MHSIIKYLKTFERWWVVKSFVAERKISQSYRTKNGSLIGYISLLSTVLSSKSHGSVHLRSKTMNCTDLKDSSISIWRFQKACVLSEAWWMEIVFYWLHRLSHTKAGGELKPIKENSMRIWEYLWGWREWQSIAWERWKKWEWIPWIQENLMRVFRGFLT